MSLRITCLVYFFLLSAISAKAQYANLKFENLSTREGLSSSTCMEMFQDSEGFMWFGTIDGLNKYDGYKFVIYRPEINNPNSISNNRITSITEDNNGNLWIGTSNGLNIFNKSSEKFYRVDLNQSLTSSERISEVINELFFDKATNMLWVATKEGVGNIHLVPDSDFSQMDLKFKHYLNKKGDSSTIDNNFAISILKDHQGFIWIGTAGKYLNRYQPQKDSFDRILIDIPKSFELDHIPKVIMIDNEGDFWIGNDLSRLIIWNRKTNEFRQISTVKGNVPIFHLYQDNAGIIWVSTDGYGIFLLEKEKGPIQHLVHNSTDLFSLPNNQPSKILEDKDGIFWIATYNKGVSKLALSKSSFGHYFYRQGSNQSLSTKIAQSVMEDSKGRIWIGTDGGGLNLFEEAANTFQHYHANINNPFSISSDKILYLLESYDGSIWVCTWDGGLNKFDPQTTRAKQYKHAFSDPFSIGQNTVWCAVEDSLHRLWLGTQTAGLNLFDPATERFYSFTEIPGDTSSLLSNFIFSIFIDSKKRLLIGTSMGLSFVSLDDLDELIPDRIAFTHLNESEIKGKRVNYITEDHKGNIWVGTDLGLYMLNSHLQLSKSYSTREGLPNNLILGIKEDHSGSFWITTKSGLSRLDIKTGNFKNFNIHDGLQGMEFQSKSIERLKDGRILVGGINGFNLFNPADIRLGSDYVHPLITDIRLFNKSIKVGDTFNGRVILEKPIANTQNLQLKYDEGYITFEFVSLYYQNPERVQYAYKMNGLDNELIFAGPNKIANYSNLPAGKYSFEVRASVDGIWEDVPKASINITVLSPPWKTWWAYLSYVVIFFVALWTAMRYYTIKVKEEKEHELDQMKLRFFINVSHEFRTPLTLILNPVDKILSTYTNAEEVKASALTIQKSARRLLNLVNQLLDFRKMDLGKAPLEIVEGDILKFIKDIFVLFNDLAEMKGIHFKMDHTLKTLPASFDPDKVEKIVTNLLSNAIKFTDPGGTVTLSVSRGSSTGQHQWSGIFKKNKVREYVEIKVQDTGIGFKPEHLKDVFRRFFHVDSTKSGTGIGLNFTKSLVELHGGKIFVESEYQKGSTFTVRLPLDGKGESAIKRAVSAFPEKYEFDINSVTSAEYEVSIGENHKESDTEADEANGTKRQVALIVEDNRELRMHLKNELRHQFKIREAVNGAEGLEKVHKYFPDIIISDVMMPEMDGFELCQRVKTEIDTCHIPFILLTARSLEEDRIEGYNFGADEYLPKPFNIHVLKARILNLLESRNRLRKKFSSFGGVLPSSELTTNSLDEMFLDKATKVVLANISDPDFNLETLLEEVGVSRSQFYRKIQSLTGQNPSNFIRTIRLKYASELLTQNKYSIKEISYMAGFNSSAYFSKTFRELFGQTPNQFIEQKSK